MRSVQIHGVNDVRIDDIPRPQVGPGDVLVKVRACGICGTDLAFIKLGATRDGEPMPLGHEAAGDIVAMGDAVSGLDLGQRVAINPMGMSDNVIGNGGSEGAFGDYLLVRNARAGHSLMAIPDDLPYQLAALVEPLGVALHAVNRAAATPQSSVVVFGAGPIGLGVVFWLKQLGVASIVAVDLTESRLERARALGAHHTLVAGREDLFAALHQRHGPATVLGAPAVGTDIFIDAAGVGAVITEVIKVAKSNARLVVVAAHHEPVVVDFGLMLRKEMQIIMSMGYPDELPRVLDTVARQRDKLSAMISHSFGFDQFFTALETARSPADAAKVMVTFADGAGH